MCADELLAKHAQDVANRPRALFLTGDQIYADDVAAPLVGHVRQMASDLVGPEDERSVPGCPPLSQVPLGGRTERTAASLRISSLPDVGTTVDLVIPVFGGRKGPSSHDQASHSHRG